MRRYCPWWVKHFWAVEKNHGSIPVWQLWGGDYWEGLGVVISEMSNVLAVAEGHARASADKYFADNPPKR